MGKSKETRVEAIEDLVAIRIGGEGGGSNRKNIALKIGVKRASWAVAGMRHGQAQRSDDRSGCACAPLCVLDCELEKWRYRAEASGQPLKKAVVGRALMACVCWLEKHGQRNSYECSFALLQVSCQAMGLRVPGGKLAGIAE